MPLHTELETRRLFLLRAEGSVTAAKIELADSERAAERAREDETADPAACLAKMVEQRTKVAALARTLREARGVLYALAEVQRSTAAEAGSTQLPVRCAQVVEALALSDSHKPRLAIDVPRTRGDMVVTLLAGFDALGVATDFGFRKDHPDDVLIKLALERRLLGTRLGSRRAADDAPMPLPRPKRERLHVASQRRNYYATPQAKLRARPSTRRTQLGVLRRSFHPFACRLFGLLGLTRFSSGFRPKPPAIRTVTSPHGADRAQRLPPAPRKSEIACAVGKQFFPAPDPDTSPGTRAMIE